MLTTTFPIKYTVDKKPLYDGSIQIHISKINNTDRKPSIDLVVTNENKNEYKVSTIHQNPLNIPINGVNYFPSKIITGATASV
jgi:hypothetical protein